MQLPADLRWALRSLASSPGLALSAVLVLSLGLGANLTVFSFFNTVLLRPLPGIRGGGDLALIGRTGRGGGFFNTSYPDYRDLRADARSFQHLAARQPAAMSVAVDGSTERIRGEAVSSNYFDALQTRIVAGRGFLPSEDMVAGDGAVAVLSHGYWVRRFASDPAAIGRVIVIDKAPFTVVGVAEPGFRGNYLPAPAEIFIPISMYDPLMLSRRNSSWLSLFGRLAEGASRARADAELHALGVSYRARHAADFDDLSFRTARFNSVDEDLGNGDASAMVAVLGTLCLLSLFVVCANVANLLLARASARTREIAIRLSLGAGRAGVIRQFLIEGLLLAAAAAPMAAVAGGWCSERLAALIPTEGAVGRIQVDAPLDANMLLAAAALTLLAALAFAGPAAWAASKTNLVAGLKTGEAGMGGAAGRARMRNTFAAVQVALSLTLLVCAALVGRSVQLLKRSDHGVALDSVAIASIDLEGAKYAQPAGKAFLEEPRRRLGELPGIRAAATSSVVPFSGSGMSLFGLWGGAVPQERRVHPYTNIQSPGFFDTIGMPLLYGRDFSPRDVENSRFAAIVNEKLARQLFPKGDPLGQIVYTGSKEVPSLEIVGVARDGLSPNPHDGILPALHLSLHQMKAFNLRQTILARTAGPPAGQLAAIRKVVADMDRNLPVFEESTLRVAFDGSFFMVTMVGAVAGFSGAMSLVVCTIGLYGLMSFTVGRRVRETGVRLALGATPASVIATMLSDGARAAAAGAGLGLALSMALTRILRSLLFGVDPAEPAVLAGAALFVTAAALAACYLPARRASRIHPSEALRYD